MYLEDAKNPKSAVCADQCDARPTQAIDVVSVELCFNNPKYATCVESVKQGLPTNNVSTIRNVQCVLRVVKQGLSTKQSP